MKFVNAAGFYEADVIVMGGDMTGKAIVPLIHQGSDKYSCTFVGRNYLVQGEDELADLEKLIRVNGFYPFRAEPDEVETLAADDRRRDEKFLTLMKESLQRWVSIAEERLAGKGITCFMTPGNDDHLEIDPLLEGSEVVRNPEGKVVALEGPDGSREMISCGWSGPTPFNTPRECTEEELAGKIDAMASRVQNMETAVFNLHNPPYGTKLDLAPLLDENLRVQSEGGQSRMVPVGSVSVRAALEDYQPQIGLHGHIHESRGQAKIRRTVCINPGSEYSEGVLRGAIVDLKGSKVKNVQLVSG